MTARGTAAWPGQARSWRGSWPVAPPHRRRARDLAPTSTAAAFPQRNYSIAAPFAWSRLIEVQGFGQRLVDPGGAALGTVTIEANAVSRFITFAVDKAALGGTPGAGWAFTVAPTGQDGFSPDQARSFAPTPQPFQLGVCAAASADPHCTADPAGVPKVMDTVPPAGVAQSAELDYTLGPWSCRGWSCREPRAPGAW